MNRPFRAAVIGLLLTLPCLQGCKSLREKTDALKDSSAELLKWHRKEGAKELETPERIVAIWSESTIFGPNHEPTRGLGGRLYFYNRNHQPVKAQGQLVVYGFEDKEANSERDAEELSHADRKFVFSDEEFANHYSPSEFGPSYSIWLPWDAVGGEKKAISVVPVFKTNEGLAVMGDHSRTLLPGKERAQLAREKARRQSYRQSNEAEAEDAVTHASFTRQSRSKTSGAAYEADEDPMSEDGFLEARTSGEDEAAEETGSIRASTIRVPPTTRQRLIESASRASSSQDESETPGLSRSLPALREAARANAREQLARSHRDLRSDSADSGDEDLVTDSEESAVQRGSAMHRRNGQTRRASASRFTRPRAETAGLAMERRTQKRSQPSSHRELNSPQVPTSQDESPEHDLLQ